MGDEIMPVVDDFVEAEFDIHNVAWQSMLSSPVDINSEQVKPVFVSLGHEELLSHLQRSNVKLIR